jgi:hypothetical protein
VPQRGEKRPVLQLGEFWVPVLELGRCQYGGQHIQMDGGYFTEKSMYHCNNSSPPHPIMMITM